LVPWYENMTSSLLFWETSPTSSDHVWFPFNQPIYILCKARFAEEDRWETTGEGLLNATVLKQQLQVNKLTTQQ